jgi:phosphoribosylanthranilate isomerase
MAKVKICGLRDEETVRGTARAGADWVGFNLIPASPRFVEDNLLELLRASADADVRSVVLFADPTPEDLRPIAGAVMPDAVQLHGKETPEFVTQMRSVLPPSVEVWKVIGVGTADDLARAEDFKAADRLVVDAKPPEGTAQTGGHGVTFDWSILDGWHAPKPWFLAGGLTPENVGAAIVATGAAAVDVSSGVERARGVKDEQLIRSFIAAAKTV